MAERFEPSGRAALEFETGIVYLRDSRRCFSIQAGPVLSPDRHPTPRPSALPLVLAGSALALALWSAADRFSWFRPSPKLEPRTITPRGALSDYERTLTEVFEENAPSVVHITTEASLRDYWGRIRSYQDGSGSGFVWDASGTIVTNDHVVAGKERVKVALLDELFDAEVIRRSPRHDLAVLRLSSVPPGLRRFRSVRPRI